MKDEKEKRLFREIRTKGIVYRADELGQYYLFVPREEEAKQKGKRTRTLSNYVCLHFLHPSLLLLCVSSYASYRWMLLSLRAYQDPATTLHIETRYLKRVARLSEIPQILQERHGTATLHAGIGKLLDDVNFRV
jgi:hypothetical protein